MSLVTWVTSHVWTILAALGGFLANQLWAKYKSRLVELRYTITVTPMAFATDDFGWGQVEIFYNKMRSGNLHLIVVELQNASSRDLSDVPIDVQVDGGTYIYRSGGQVTGSLKQIPFSPSFLALTEKVAQNSASEQEIALQVVRTEFILPSLNRGSVAHLQFLVSRNDYATPTLTLGCDQAGVRVRHLALETSQYGVRHTIAQAVGLPAGLLGVTALVLSNAPPLAIGLGAIVLGWFGILLGVGLTRIWRWIGALLDS